MVILDIKNLTLEIESNGVLIKALDKVSLTIQENEIRALVGESGSGKSLIVRAISGALPPQWIVTADRLTWRGENLLTMTRAQRQAIMRRDIAVIFQDPMAALDPSARLKEQLLESVPDEFIEGRYSWERKRSRMKIAEQILHRVGINEVASCINKYPHELSLDICQKFMIAMALISQPTLLIADDPTRGMETNIKKQILALLTHLNKTRELSILFVGHDLLAISAMAHSMTVLYCGQTVESGKMKALRKRPLHPYTKALMDSAPSFSPDLQPKSMLVALEGTIPTLQHLPIGCRLGPRCPRATKECVQVPMERTINEHKYRCHHPLHLQVI
ncbi:MAG: Peptide transport system ATP-binding protein SapD [Glaciecola sp. HTCC2999]|jgi:cationic peptide transport system ATP-binding protein|nr:MAG: Peptide transport system ATP-binding protein SapD [Glaciecola sp. HTCC2999]